MNTPISTAYNYKVVRFAIMTVVWGIVGMGSGFSRGPIGLA
jgi:cbb3-type cytochrome oxidase subunit 1